MSKIISFANFARIASICVGFHLVHCMITIFCETFGQI